MQVLEVLVVERLGMEGDVVDVKVRQRNCEFEELMSEKQVVSVESAYRLILVASEVLVADGALNLDMTSHLEVEEMDLADLVASTVVDKSGCSASSLTAEKADSAAVEDFAAPVAWASRSVRLVRLFCALAGD